MLLVASRSYNNKWQKLNANKGTNNLKRAKYRRMNQHERTTHNIQPFGNVMFCTFVLNSKVTCRVSSYFMRSFYRIKTQLCVILENIHKICRQ